MTKEDVAAVFSEWDSQVAARKAIRDEEKARLGPLFERMDDIAENWADRAIPWVVPGMVFYGGVTLVSGSPKAGKSTLVADMVRSREDGTTWLDRSVTPGTTILLTEEAGYPVVSRWAYSHDLIVMQHHIAAAHHSLDQSLRLDERLREPFIDWVEGQVTEAIEDTPGKALVVIDTLAVWSGIEDENDSMETTKAVIRWTNLASRTGAAIILVHHARKGGGQYGESIRGSTAILATVAMSLELAHISPDSDDRRLDVRGRLTFGERLRVAFDRDTARYSLSTAAEAGEDRSDLRGYLKELEPVIYTSAGVTATEAASMWGKTRNAAVTRLEAMEEAGLLRKGEKRLVSHNLTATWTAAAILPPGFHGRVDE